MAWLLRPKHEILGDGYISERTVTLWSSVAQVREPVDSLHYGDHVEVLARRNDNVKVMAGKDRGKEGRVLRVFPDEGRVLVEHIMNIKKHVRPNPQQRIQGGIAEQEAKISLSNVALICGTCGPVRIGHEVRGDKKVRVCKKCGTTLDK